jgi:hypothetical protein
VVVDLEVPEIHAAWLSALDALGVSIAAASRPADFHSPDGMEPRSWPSSDCRPKGEVILFAATTDAESRPARFRG